METTVPAILTTSQLLTTGVDAPTCKNIVLARVVSSMTEFKQIIGRGTRVRDDYGKLCFNILDYTGSATRLFADPEFDGDPAHDHRGGDRRETARSTGMTERRRRPGERRRGRSRAGASSSRRAEERRKFYFDGGQVEIAAHLVYELDPDGKQLRVVRYTDYTAEKVRTLCPDRRRSCAQQWADPANAAEIIERLEERGIDFDELAEAAEQPEADPFDLLCHLAFNAPLAHPPGAGRSGCAQSARTSSSEYGPEARQILDELLEKYAEHGDAQFVLPDVLKVPPISEHGTVAEIVELFGGADQLRAGRGRTAEPCCMPR